MVRAGRHAQHDAGTPLRSVVVVCAGGSRMRAPFLSSFSLGARFPMGRAGDAAGAALVGPSVCRERAAVAGVGGLPRPSDGIPSVPGRPPASRSSRCCPRSRERARAALNDALDASAACVGLARVSAFPRRRLRVGAAGKRVGNAPWSQLTGKVPMARLGQSHPVEATF